MMTGGRRGGLDTPQKWLRHLWTAPYWHCDDKLLPKRWHLEQGYVVWELKWAVEALMDDGVYRQFHLLSVQKLCGAVKWDQQKRLGFLGRGGRLDICPKKSVTTVFAAKRLGQITQYFLFLQFKKKKVRKCIRSNKLTWSHINFMVLAKSKLLPSIPSDGSPRKKNKAYTGCLKKFANRMLQLLTLI